MATPAKRTCRFTENGIEITEVNGSKTTFRLPDGAELVGYEQVQGVVVHEVANVPQRYPRGDYALVLHVRDPGIAVAPPEGAPLIEAPLLEVHYREGAKASGQLVDAEAVVASLPVSKAPPKPKA